MMRQTLRWSAAIVGALCWSACSDGPGTGGPTGPLPQSSVGEEAQLHPLPGEEGIVSAKPRLGIETGEPRTDRVSTDRAYLAPAYATAAMGAPSILLLSDIDIAATTALVNALTAAGNNVTHRPAPEYTWNGTNPPLDGFQCVVHLDGFTYFQPLPVAAQQMLETFVSNGGGFIASQWDGYELTVNQQVNMPNLVLQRWADGNTNNCGGCSITYSTVSGQAGHPVLAGVPSAFTFFADGHDAGSQRVFGSQPSTVLMRAQSGGPGVLVRDFGSGHVVNFSHAANYLQGGAPGITLMDGNIQKLYTNAAAWACGPRVIEVDIDIKPGSDPNSVGLMGTSRSNGTGGGVIPVAILSTTTFDASSVDASTVTLGDDDGDDTPVAQRRNGTLMASLEDVDGDADLDLVLHFDQAALEANGDLDASTTDLCINGQDTGGTPIHGCDAVRIVP
ncbi:MAG: hypothetical protein HY701_10200 [Gemmatimonadetes bacterium]|nr:hypothetical protein [Gemmatimonadota bacterium]